MRVSAPEAKRCLDCGYILDHLTELRCPECGRVFNPTNPWSYTGSPQSCRPLLAATVCAALLQSAPILVYVEQLACVYVVLAVLGAVIHVWVIVAAIRLLPMPRAAVANRATGALAALLSVLLLPVPCLLSLRGC